MQDQSESSFFQVESIHHDEAVEQLELQTGSRQHQFYKVCHNGRYYFLKSLHSDYLHQEYYREVLRKEYELGTQLHSEYIVGYHALTDTPEECSLLMDYVNGMTLGEFHRQHPDYFKQSDHLLKLLRQLCLALHELHSHQALHLDLKPSNIMLTHVNHDVRLIDLGCSYADARPDLIGQTRTYAAPEQLDGTYDVDARTDIYALGKILEQLSPHQPFFQKIVRRCLHERKEERFQSAEELLHHLEKHKRRTPYYFIFALVALLVVAGIFVWRNQSTNSAADQAITEGTTFVDTSCHDTLYLRVLSTADHSVAVVQSPKGGHTYQGDIVMPDSVLFHGQTFFIRELDQDAFRECSLLTNIHFPPTLTTIRSSALRKCVSLTNLHLPPSLHTLLYEPFSSCFSLSHVSWPASATVVPRNCFVACHSLRRIMLPEGVTAIHQDAFTDCNSLEDISLPSTLERLDRGVFYQCSSLRSITLPEHVKVLGEYLFYGCSSLEELRVLAPVPPDASAIVDSSFHGVVRVPAASLEAYQKAPVWSELPLLPL